MSEVLKRENRQGRIDLLLLDLAKQAARIVEAKTGCSFWDGEDGLSGVLEDKVREMKIPDKPIDLVRPVSVRALAEQAGFIKRRRKLRGAK